MAERKAILVVDDMEENRVILVETFMRQYDVLEAENGVIAMKLIRKNAHRLSLILLDIVMPVMDGYAVLEAMHQEGFADIPVVVVTVAGQVENEIRILDMGVADMVLKPVDSQIVFRRVQNIIQAHYYKTSLENEIRVQQERMEKSYQAVVDTIHSIISHRNMDSAKHTLRVSAVSKLLLEKLAVNYPEYHLNQENIRMMTEASLLHDVGKILISEELFRKTGNLTQEEKALMESHCEESSKIIGIFEQTGQKEFVHYANDICHYHHELWNGLGYPAGLKGENIPIYVQAVSLALFYDDLEYPSDYRKSYAIAKVKEESGRSFSERMVDCFETNYDYLEKMASYYDDLSDEESNKMVLNRLTDIFYHNKQIDASHYSQYHSLLRYVNATVYEIDVVERTYSRVYTTFSDFNSIPANGNFQDDFIVAISDEIYPTFRDIVLDYFKKLTIVNQNNSELSLGETCRIYNTFYGEYHWYQVSSVNIEETGSNHQKVLLIMKNVNSNVSAISEMARLNSQSRGRAKDIHRFKLENEKLKIKAHVDELTGLYDAMTTQEMIKEIIKSYPGSNYGLIVIDLDDFQYVNNTFGYLEGDKALKYFANTLKSQFRQSDIIGRVGDDEFIVFMTDIPSVHVIESKAEQLMLLLKAHDDEEDNYRNHLAVSIGISLYPENGADYNTLLNKADKALFMAKKLGRGRCQVYCGDGIIDVTSQAIDLNSRVVKAKEKVQILDEFNQALPLVMLETNSIDEMMETLLDKVARHYELDSAFVVDAKTSGIVYRWHAKASPLSSLPSIDTVDSVVPELFKEQKIWSCDNTSVLPYNWAEYFNKMGTKTIIAAPCYWEGKLIGIVEFTGQPQINKWTPDAIEACSIVTKIATNVLHRGRLEIELKQYQSTYRI